MSPIEKKQQRELDILTSLYDLSEGETRRPLERFVLETSLKYPEHELRTVLSHLQTDGFLEFTGTSVTLTDTGVHRVKVSRNEPQVATRDRKKRQ